jgi:hypothetical protein
MGLGKGWFQVKRAERGVEPAVRIDKVVYWHISCAAARRSDRVMADEAVMARLNKIRIWTDEVMHG